MVRLLSLLFFSSCTVCHKKECQSILNYLSGDNDNNNNDDDDDDDDNNDYEDVDDRFPKIQFPFFEALK